jgi:hypothetical protein
MTFGDTGALALPFRVLQRVLMAVVDNLVVVRESLNESKLYDKNIIAVN